MKTQFLSLLLIVSFGSQTTFVYASENRNNVAARSAAQNHRANVNRANQTRMRATNELKERAAQLMKTRGTKNGPDDFVSIYTTDKRVKLRPPNEKQARDASETYRLFKTLYTDDNVWGTFLESAGVGIESEHGPHDWDMLFLSGMKNMARFEKAIKLAVEANVKTIRIALDHREIDINNPGSFGLFLKRVEILIRNGVTPVITIDFFSLLRKFVETDGNGNIDHLRSYLLNPRYPQDRARAAELMMKQLMPMVRNLERELGRKVNFMINPINEPETLAGFNRHFWHDKHKRWGDPEYFRYYILSIINIAKANVLIRTAIEQNSDGRHIMTFENEAMTGPDYPSHLGKLRFAVSKFMLGHPDLLKVDFDRLASEPLDQMFARLTSVPESSLKEVDICFKEFVFSVWNKSAAEREQARNELVQKFRELTGAHANFARKTVSRDFPRGKTMYTHLMLYVDYYYQTEFILNKSVPNLVKEISANYGEKLKYGLQVENDADFVAMLERYADKAEAMLGNGTQIMQRGLRREQIDFEQLLNAEDNIMLELMVGLRYETGMNNDARFVARRSLVNASVWTAPLNRTDKLLNAVLADRALTKKILGIEVPVEQARALLNQSARKLLIDYFGLTMTRRLGFEPQHYAIQMLLNMRIGFAQLMATYAEELGVYAVGAGEYGTPYTAGAPMVSDQMLLESARAFAEGIFAGLMNPGPLVDTRGWGKGPVSFHIKDDHEVNPSGMLRLVYEGQRDPAKPHARGSRVIDVEYRRFRDNPAWIKLATESFTDLLRKHAQAVSAEQIFTPQNSCEARLVGGS